MQAGCGGEEEATEARQAGLELLCEREEVTAAGARCEAERATADWRSGKGWDRTRKLRGCERPGRGQQAGGTMGLREGRRLEGMGQPNGGLPTESGGHALVPQRTRGRSVCPKLLWTPREIFFETENRHQFAFSFLQLFL